MLRDKLHTLARLTVSIGTGLLATLITILLQSDFYAGSEIHFLISGFTIGTAAAILTYQHLRLPTITEVKAFARDSALLTAAIISGGVAVVLAVMLSTHLPIPEFIPFFTIPVVPLITFVLVYAVVSPKSAVSRTTIAYMFIALVVLTSSLTISSNISSFNDPDAPWTGQDASVDVDNIHCVYNDEANNTCYSVLALSTTVDTEFHVYKNQTPNPILSDKGGTIHVAVFRGEQERATEYVDYSPEYEESENDAESLYVYADAYEDGSIDYVFKIDEGRVRKISA